MARRAARRYVVRGRVQGVGFRTFVQHTAGPIGVTGWARNLDDGTVEVYAIGNPEQLSTLEAALHRGPRWSEVRGVTAKEDTINTSVRGFQIR